MLKCQKTIEWHDRAKEESPGVFIVAGVRDAKAPDGSTVEQIYNCRVERLGDKWELRMVQVFKESSKTGKDMFLLPRKKS
jgi:hypothetical protein